MAPATRRGLDEIFISPNSITLSLEDRVRSELLSIRDHGLDHCALTGKDFVVYSGGRQLKRPRVERYGTVYSQFLARLPAVKEEEDIASTDEEEAEEDDLVPLSEEELRLLSVDYWCHREHGVDEFSDDLRKFFTRSMSLIRGAYDCVRTTTDSDIVQLLRDDDAMSVLQSLVYSLTCMHRLSLCLRHSRNLLSQELNKGPHAHLLQAINLPKFTPSGDELVRTGKGLCFRCWVSCKRVSHFTTRTHALQDVHRFLSLVERIAVNNSYCSKEDKDITSKRVYHILLLLMKILLYLDSEFERQAKETDTSTQAHGMGKVPTAKNSCLQCQKLLNTSEEDPKWLAELADEEEVLETKFQSSIHASFKLLLHKFHYQGFLDGHSELFHDVEARFTQLRTRMELEESMLMVLLKSVFESCPPYSKEHKQGRLHDDMRAEMTKELLEDLYNNTLNIRTGEQGMYMAFQRLAELLDPSTEMMLAWMK